MLVIRDPIAVGVAVYDGSVATHLTVEALLISQVIGDKNIYESNVGCLWVSQGRGAIT